ncbi:MAG: amidohydrolase [Pseudomonadota bacterium]
MDFCTTPLREEMVAWRHDFHTHPELGFEETRTSARVAELLESFGITVHTQIGGTGVVGVLDRGSGPSVGLRADMDALPIHEQTNLPYASETEGVMHACGHDGHTTMLLGAAKYLATAERLKGRVVFIFQPNEEHGFGAKAMLDDGLFDRFPVDQVFGIHNMPGMPVGAAAMRAGAMTASEALFEIRVHARGGHAALPHMGVDAITVGAQIVDNLQTIVSRKLNPGLNGVVSVTEFETDGRRNVLPGQAILRGDARALTPDTNAAIEHHMRQIVAGITQAHGVEATVEYDTAFIPTTNAPHAVQVAAKSARSLFSDVDDACEPKLFSEDFSHIAAAVPGCFLLLGNGATGAHARPLHSADYDFNDDLLVPGSAYWVRLVEHCLGEADV